MWQHFLNYLPIADHTSFNLSETMNRRCVYSVCTIQTVCVQCVCTTQKVCVQCISKEMSDPCDQPFDVLCEKSPNTWCFLVRIFPYSSQIRERRTRKNSVFGYFSSSDVQRKKELVLVWNSLFSPFFQISYENWNRATNCVMTIFTPFY